MLALDYLEHSFLNCVGLMVKAFYSTAINRPLCAIVINQIMSQVEVNETVALSQQEQVGHNCH